jgi:hypothetical protein
VRFTDYLGQYWAQPFRTSGGKAANGGSSQFDLELKGDRV